MKTANVCLVGLVFVVWAWAEPLLEGRVRLESGDPVADAQVRLFDLTDLQQGAIARAQTDGRGYFALPLAALRGSALPEGFALGPNYPNPFNPSTIIPYQLAASSAVRLEVFNLLGQRIATLVDGERPAGFHTAMRHATDARGRAVGAGVYIYRMTVGAASQTGRMVLIDGQAGVSAGGVASVLPGASGGGGSTGERAEYGLLVSGSGLVPYVDSSFRVEAGMAPVELVVSAGGHSAGKAPDDDGAFSDLFDALSDDEEEGAGPSGKAQATLDAPAAPTNLRFEAVTDSSCRVRWDAAEGATDYDVNYKRAVGGQWTNEPHKGVRLYTTIYDLEPNTEYRWAVRAENSDGPSEWVFGPNFTTAEEETDETTGSSDDHSNTRSGATELSLGSSLAGQIETGSDVDYFSVQVGESGTLTVYTTGSLDTKGTLENSSGSKLASNDDGDSDTNFRIEVAVSAGTYYIKVESYRERTGSYTIHANETPEGEDETPEGEDETPEGEEEDAPEDTAIDSAVNPTVITRDLEYDYTISLSDDWNGSQDWGGSYSRRSPWSVIRITSLELGNGGTLEQYASSVRDGLEREWWPSRSLFQITSFQKTRIAEQDFYSITYRVQESPEYCVVDVSELVTVSDALPGSQHGIRVRMWMCESDVRDYGPDRTQILHSFRVTVRPSTYYRQFLSTKGIVIKATDKVDPQALYVAGDIVNTMLLGRQDIAACMADVGAALAIIPKDEYVTTVPEFAWLKGRRDFTGRTYESFAIRGLGAVRGQPVSATSEESLLGLPGLGYPFGSLITVHEFAHAIQNLCFTQNDHAKWDRFYSAALQAGIFPGTHMMADIFEFFAVLSTAYFEVTDEIGRGADRNTVRQDFPEIFASLEEIYGGATLPAELRKRLGGAGKRAVSYRIVEPVAGQSGQIGCVLMDGHWHHRRLKDPNVESF